MASSADKILSCARFSVWSLTLVSERRILKVLSASFIFEVLFDRLMSRRFYIFLEASPANLVGSIDCFAFQSKAAEYRLLPVLVQQ